MNKAARYLTELVGTYLFLLVIAVGSTVNSSLLPLAIGGALMVMVYMGGHVSGGHYNPAVTLGVWLRKKMPTGDLIPYWIAQFVGGLAAFQTGILLARPSNGIQPNTGVSPAVAVVVEAIFTMMLVLVVLNTACTKKTEGNSFYGLAIGFTVVVAVIAGGPVSGGAFNPAIGLGATYGGVAFGSHHWSHLWIYLVGPFIGGAVAAAIHSVQVGKETD